MSTDLLGAAVVVGQPYVVAGIVKADEGSDTVLLQLAGGRHALRVAASSIVPVAGTVLDFDALAPDSGGVPGLLGTDGSGKWFFCTMAGAADGDVLVYDSANYGVNYQNTLGLAKGGTGANDAAGARSSLSASRQQGEQFLEVFDDLEGYGFPFNGWAQSSTGTSAGCYQASDHVDATYHAMGEIGFSTGSTATGRAAMLLNKTGILLGGGTAHVLEWRGTVGAASTVAEEFVVVWGLQDNGDASAEPTHGAYFAYRRTVDGDFWVCVTRDNGTETKTVTTVVPGAYSTLRTFRIEINAAGTSVVFKIDGATKATHTTNIPTAAGRRVGLAFKQYKTAGTTARFSYMDWVYRSATRTAAR